MSLGNVFVSEALGTAILILLGVGVVANNVLPRTGGRNGGNLMVGIGWGFGVMAGAFVAYKSGGHLNPALTLGMWASGAKEYAPGVAVTLGSTMAYLGGQLLGAFVGAVLAWAAHKKHFDEHGEATTQVFATAPAIRAPFWNVITELLGTFVLVFVVLCIAKAKLAVGPIPVAFLIVTIGMGLGGPTGWAINPVRDLMPRLAHAVLPIPDKDDSDWGYAWVPVVGPLLGGILAGLLAHAYIG